MARFDNIKVMNEKLRKAVIKEMKKKTATEKKENNTGVKY